MFELCLKQHYHLHMHIRRYILINSIMINDILCNKYDQNKNRKHMLRDD